MYVTEQDVTGESGTDDTEVFVVLAYGAGIDVILAYGPETWRLANPYVVLERIKGLIVGALEVPTEIEDEGDDRTAAAEEVVIVGQTVKAE